MRRVAKGISSHIFEALAAAGPTRVWWTARTPRPTAARQAEKGERSQAIGRSRGWRTTKIHALSDGQGRPMAFVLSGGQVADCRVAGGLLEGLPAEVLVLADKAYDTDAIRRGIEAHGAVPTIPPKSNRTWKSCFSPVLFRGRNGIEGMFGRLKDFRRIATPYDRLATNDFAATASYWL